MIEVFNSDILLKISKDIPIDEIKKTLEKEFSSLTKINIIFLNKKDIKKLNQQYRKKREVTDVLSFNIDSNTLLGEIYICPEYVINSIDKKDFQKQTIRLIIHGILHLEGYNHKEKFEELDYKNEPMYIEQERILNNLLIKILRK